MKVCYTSVTPLSCRSASVWWIWWRLSMGELPAASRVGARVVCGPVTGLEADPPPPATAREVWGLLPGGTRSSDSLNPGVARGRTDAVLVVRLDAESVPRAVQPAVGGR